MRDKEWEGEKEVSRGEESKQEGREMKVGWLSEGSRQVKRHRECALQNETGRE